jgi:ribosomal protein S18 acetylase RimI-like enzyme
MNPAQELTIRRADTDDVDALVGFSSAMAWETEHRRLDGARLREGTQALLSTPSLGFFLVTEARISERCVVVGQLMVTYEWSDWRNGVFWWIQSVYVDPGWRRQGVFRRMHDAALSQAKADPKVCGIRLYVEQDNQIAQTVYRRLGLSLSHYKIYEQDFVLTQQKGRPDPGNS